MRLWAKLGAGAGALLILAGAAYWYKGRTAEPPTTSPGVVSPGTPSASAPGGTAPLQRTGRDLSAGVCPGGGELAVAVAGSAAAGCTALPLIQPIYPWQPLDPSPTMPSFSHPEPAQRNRYQLDLKIDPERARIDGQMRLQVVNTDDVALSELYFHLYPNAPYFKQNWNGRVERPGSLTVTGLRIDGNPVAFTGGSEELLALSLAQPLAPGASLAVEITYSAVIPSIDNDRFGADGRTLFLGNAYPILAMHDQAGWHLDPYLAVGDPFYSPVADYEVKVQVPAGYDVAATGRKAGPDFTFTAERVRDFGLAVSNGWSRHERLVDGVQLHYLRDERLNPGNPTPEQVLDQIEGAVRFFGQRFGPYPYPDLTVVDKVGMEYPQFIMGGPELHTVIHEIAHQWWYGVVGNDELRQIWDEGLTDFSAQLYEASVGLETPANRLTLTDKGNWPMDDSLYRYAAGQDRGQLSYGQVLYRRGWRVWEALRQQMGDARFFPMVQSFYQQHKFGIATWADWRQAVAAAGDEGALALFDQWVYGKPVPAGAPSRVAPYKE